jgi:hypothetical protein
MNTDSIVVINKTDIAVAQDVVIKTNKVAHKALSYINEASATPVDVRTAKQNNRNFMLWLLLVGSIVAIAGSLTFTLNKRKAYECAHTARPKRRNENIRYW